jgi:drug/metabolite transporter (DMT)-like permease
MQERVAKYVAPTKRASQLDVRWMVVIGAAFVLCWASGFVVPRVFIPFSEPLSFVALRNGGAAFVLIAVALALHAEWPRECADVVGLLWAGACLQGFSLMGLYWAVYWGLPVGTAALAGGLQPAITAVFAMVLLGEKLATWQWAGVALGFLGLAETVWPKIEFGGTRITLLASAIAGVASMAYASVYQKRFAEIGNAWTRTALMFVGATMPAAIGAMLFEHGHINWNVSMIAVYTWSVIALAVGATMGLLFLIARGQASQAASLIYLVPPTSALMAYIGFGERISRAQIAGYVISAIGVALVQFCATKTPSR